MSWDTFEKEHIYKRLGGWLAFFWIVNILSTGIAIIALPGLLASSQFAEAMRSEYSAYLTAATIIAVVSIALSVAFIVLLFKKHPSFALIYEIGCLISVASSLSPLLVGAFDFSRILGSILGFAIWEAYIRNSVRVRTYMGSGEYLLRTLFARSASPEPAVPDDDAPPEPDDER
ncbi:MAG: DUF2569 domain-containing protein [Oscillospiraceae bacterium]|jgi:hypothetical protein|nr:DUF2569 domain-containing protein [Oscillospiraceae bacterium]